ncbi:MAG: prefoldin subunit beta [bacterium]|nr:prefoldin subunit beta [bacterium]
MTGKKETEQKIQQLQMMEQSLQNLLMQKQGFHMQLSEIDSAIKELQNTTDAYKIVGSIMVSAKKEELVKELTTKKETTELRVKAIEKQESGIRDQASALQKEVIGEMKEK